MYRGSLHKAEDLSKACGLLAHKTAPLLVEVATSTNDDRVLRFTTITARNDTPSYNFNVKSKCSLCQ
jgi:hypothetical protein